MKKTGSNRLVISSIVAWIAGSVPLVAWAGIDEPFDASYTVLMDGKPRMETRIRLQRQDTGWTLESEGKGIKGLARMLRIRNHEHATLEWSGSGYRPQNYRHHSKVAGKDQRWQASFEPDGSAVTLSHDDGDDRFQLDTAAFDPASVSLEIRRRLTLGETGFTIRVLDEDEIDEHTYRSVGTEFMDSGVGCREVIVLERVRNNSRRYSRGWYAKNLAYLPLRIQHGKEDGNDFDMRIQSLTIDGQAVQPTQACDS